MMSLDGVITGAGGEMSWLGEHISGDNPTARGCSGAGTRRGSPNGGAWNGLMVVHAYDPDEAPVEGVHVRRLRRDPRRDDGATLP